MTPEDEEFEAIAKRQASYTGNGTAGRENMTAPTGFLFQMPRSEWVGLTEEEINEVLGGDIRDEPSGLLVFVRAIEAKLKEKNT